jgi:hypothetical protein
VKMGNRIQEAFSEFCKRLSKNANMEGMTFNEVLDLKRLKDLDKEWNGRLMDHDSEQIIEAPAPKSEDYPKIG